MPASPAQYNLLNKLAQGGDVVVHAPLKTTPGDQYARGYLEGAGFTVETRKKPAIGWTWKIEDGNFAPVVSQYSAAQAAYPFAAYSYDLRSLNYEPHNDQWATPDVTEPAAREALTLILLANLSAPDTKKLTKELGSLPYQTGQLAGQAAVLADMAARIEKDDPDTAAEMTALASAKTAELADLIGDIRAVVTNIAHEQALVAIELAAARAAAATEQANLVLAGAAEIVPSPDAQPLAWPAKTPEGMPFAFARTLVETTGVSLEETASIGVGPFGVWCG
jgi:hypothetical protein